ncbi:polysaccharide pyruvyl transferase family protein [Sodaliphilus sp.]|uniref:polysaccharide pyruvyl transferase family protein n=1 Tax=Sodaliphilus sp. TaxID=2815818 RepID=UPI0038902B11
MNLRYLHYRFRLYSFLHQDKSFALPTNKRKVFVFLAADYGNLGDVAITYAQEKLLKEKYPDYEIMDVPISKTLSLLRPIKKIVTPDDIITITGGGNMGEMYGDIELLRLMVIRMFPKNKVVVFPLTTDYSGVKTYLLRLAKHTYCNHRNLTMLAREEVSYNRMCELFPKVNVKLTPDVVMTLDERRKSQRNGVVFCIRNDKEKSKHSLKAEELRKEATKIGLPIMDYDTHIEKEHMSLDVRKDELDKIWNIFSSSQLVVTDRLHGMIFAYITGTPAIVFPNSNFKVEKCYEWIKDCGYIQFCKECNATIKLEQNQLNIASNWDLGQQNFVKIICDNL